MASHYTPNPTHSFDQIDDSAEHPATAEHREATEPSIYLRDVLSERHVNMITLSCCIGVGLFLQCGHVIYLAGPGMAIIAYLLTGSIIGSTMACLGEMTALFPIEGPLFQFPSRFLDAAVGYAVGWMAWFAWIVILAAELLAITQLFKFEFEDSYLQMVGLEPPLRYPQAVYDVNPAAWVLVFWVVVLLVNLLPVRWYGELEYLFGCFKLIFIVGLIMFNVALSAMGNGYRENGRSTPFWTYSDPYGFSSNGITLTTDGTEGATLTITGLKGRFLATWTAMTAVLFSMIGFEAVAVTAAENKDLRNQETVKIATRKITLRILVLYTLCAFTAGLNVPYQDANLENFATNSIRSGQYSIFVLAAVRSKLPQWARTLNGVFIFSATTSAINSLYIASRMLHALATETSVWPEWDAVQSLQRRLQTTKYGVPMAAIFVSWLFGSLAFLSQNGEPTQVLSNLATNSVVSMLIVYTAICISYLRFDKIRQKFAKSTGLGHLSPDEIETERSKFDRRSPAYPYKSHWQWMRACYGLLGCLLFVIFLGWSSFTVPFKKGQFIASYISIPVFVVLTIAYRFKLDDVDPREWRLMPSTSERVSMSNPQTVEKPQNRTGRLNIDLDDNTFTLENANKVREFIWAWLK